MTDFKGENIWIIGASSGMGRALAIELASRDAILFLSARDTKKLETLHEEIGLSHHLIPLDVTDVSSVDVALSSVKAKTSKIDRVIYMAGTYEPMGFEAMNLDRAVEIIHTNLIGAVNVVHTVLPTLMEQEKAQIVFCASVAGYRGLPKAQPYGATKAGLINFAESLHVEMLGQGIDVKVINPGFVRTPMTDKNKFNMPMMIEANEASKKIANGLLAKKFEIHFPKRFTFIMKILKILPPWLYFYLLKK